MLTVTLGVWGDAGVITGGGGLAKCGTLANCRRVTQAGTLMHEFGHSLGLHHGGRDDVQFKPNYLSVMNYMFQTRGRVPDRPLDYSRVGLAPLDEHALVDGAGILGGLDGVTSTLVSVLWPHTGFYRANAGSCSLLNASTGGPIDWDGSVPTLTSPVLVHDKVCGDTQQVLKSSADWPDLRYSFRDQEGASDEPRYGDASFAHEEPVAELLAEKARSDVDGNGINDLADACRIVAGTDVADANGNGFADACEPDMNRLQAFPQQPGGSGGGGGGGGGASPGPVKDTTAPALSGLSARPSVAQRAKGRRKAKPATLRFSVTEASTVTFTAEQVAQGPQGRQALRRRRQARPRLHALQAGRGQPARERPRRREHRQLRGQARDEAARRGDVPPHRDRDRRGRQPLQATDGEAHRPLSGLRSSRCTAGPCRTLPSTAKREPWHGQSQLRSARLKFT